MLNVRLRDEVLESETEEEMRLRLNPVITWRDFRLASSKRSASISGLESDPEWFFSHTRPTEAMKYLVDGIRAKLEGKASGIFPLLGKLGTGKSHLVLFIYHLFRNTEYANEWLEDWEMYFKPPTDVNLIPLPLASVSIDNLWEPVFDVLSRDMELREDDWPRPDVIKESINKPTIILVDEIDTWYDAKDGRGKARNRGFIQALSETSATDVPLITIITSTGFSDESKRMLETFSRNVGGSLISLERPKDTFEIVRFRLFDEIYEEEAKETVHEYARIYHDMGVHADPDEMHRTYPFHPSFLKALTSLPVRRLLLLLADIVKHNMDKDLLITSDMVDRSIESYLRLVDDRLVDAFFDDLEFLKRQKEVKEGVISYDLCRGFLLTSLLFSLDNRAASYDDLVFGAVRTQMAQPDIDDTLAYLQKWTRLRREDDRYVFSIELPPVLKIERRANLIDDDEAIRRLDDLIRRKSKEIRVKGAKIVFDVGELQKDERFKIAVLTSKPDNVDEIYERTYENTIVLIYPYQDLLSSENLQSVKRIIATEELLREVEETEIYEEFLDEHKRNADRIIRDADWQMLTYSRAKLGDEAIAVEKAIHEFKAVNEMIKEYTSRENFRYFLELILDGLDEDESISVREIKKRFYRLRGLPLMVDEKNLYLAMSDLVADGVAEMVGLQGVIFYKTRVSTSKITDDCVLQAPKEVSTPPPEEIYQLIKEKRKLRFKDVKDQYPRAPEDKLVELLDGICGKYDDIYPLEGRAIVKRPGNIKSTQFLTCEEATKPIQTELIKVLSKKLAIPLDKAKSEIAERHMGIDDSLINVASDELEIAGKAAVDRKKRLIQLPERELLDGLKREIFNAIKKDKEIAKEDVISDIVASTPVGENLIENAITELCDEEKIIEDGGRLRIYRPPSPPPSTFEGSASQVLQEIDAKLGVEEELERIGLEITERAYKDDIKVVLEAIGDKKVKIKMKYKRVT